MQELIRGVQVRRNGQNNLVIQVHYSADPEKDPVTPTGRLWFNKTSGKYVGGATSLGWRREYEIDFDAGAGELVFPEFGDLENDIVCDPFRIDDENIGLFTINGGLDWGGVRNPCANTIFAERNDGTFFAVWETCADRQTVADFSRKIHEFPLYDSVEIIHADLSMWTENQSKKDGLTSIAEMFNDGDEVGNDYVVNKLSPTHDRSDLACITKTLQLWQQKRFKIFRTCPNLIRELRNLKYPERREFTNETEKILDKDNHSWDTWKYYILSHPSARNIETKPKYGTYGYLNRVTELATIMAEQSGRSVQEEFNDLYGREL